ncbi:ABC transporter permease [Salisaeta longa]|uniref:ABC transporter permease n=1 Tax=Salisaeta longa TaxID=503170 RepID=UPI0003B4DEE3|nr:ABC transporter permease [Salisaeta longa]
MDYRLQIARRYLLGRRNVSLISIITGISSLGVMLGVAALIVVLSVMNGFYDFVRDLLVSLDPHVRIVRADGAPMARADSVAQVARRLPMVASAAPYVAGKALLVTDNGITGPTPVVQVHGVGAQAALRTGAHEHPMAYGRFDVSTDSAGAGAVVSLGMGQRLGLLPAGTGRAGATVGLLSAPALEQALTSVFGGPSIQQFTVRGLYRPQAAGTAERVFIGLEPAQRLFNLAGRASGVDLRLQRLAAAPAAKDALQQRLGARFAVRTWYDLQESLYDVMRLEKWGASAILLLIVIVAAFNIVGSLTMVVIEKRSDVGALMTMGVSRRNIQKIFLLEGAIIGAVGTGGGVLLGLGLALIQQYFKVVPMAQAESFLIDAYPVMIRASDILLIAGVAFVMCIAAAWYPATRAARIVPAEAVHLDA